MEVVTSPFSVGRACGPEAAVVCPVGRGVRVERRKSGAACAYCNAKKETRRVFKPTGPPPCHHVVADVARMPSLQRSSRDSCSVQRRGRLTLSGAILRLYACTGSSMRSPRPVNKEPRPVSKAGPAVFTKVELTNRSGAILRLLCLPDHSGTCFHRAVTLAATARCRGCPLSL